MSDPSRISKLEVSAVDAAGNQTEKVACESFWKETSCVIIFFRRFGWQFCRLAAKDLSDLLKPKLDANNVRFIGVGFDDKFLKPFVDGKFFAGELYIDTEKQCYNALQFRRVGVCEALGGLCGRKWSQVAANAKSKGIEGDMKGDGMQNGGTLVIGRKGRLLFEYLQVDPSDHIEANDVLKSLEIN